MPQGPDTIAQAWLHIIPSEAERRSFLASGQYLVHYSDFATEILASNEIRLRNARNMKDQSEIKIGRDCVDKFFSENNEKIKKALTDIQPDLYEKLVQCWNNEYEAQIDRTFIACFTAQAANDSHGSEYHWDKYGKVALCLDPGFLRDEPSQLSLYLEKVTYGRAAISVGLGGILTALQTHCDLLRSLNPDILLSLLRHSLFFASVASKYDNFSSEKEWRLIHAPFLFSSAHVAPDQRNYANGPEDVYILKFEDPVGTNSSGLATRDLVRKVLIHPGWQGSATDLKRSLVSQLMYRRADKAADRVTILERLGT